MKLDADVLQKLPFALRVEIEENAQRKPLTQSELAVEQRRILAELRKHKASGKRSDLKAGTSGKLSPEVRATDLVGKLFSESRKQVEKRLAFVEAAEAEPERFGKLVEDMNRNDSPNGPHRRLVNMKKAAAIRAEPPPLPGKGPYRVAVVDVPWPSEPDDPEPSERGYWTFPTMSIEALCKLDVAPIMHEDSILWFWTTNFHMRFAYTILDAWGFHVPTILTWAKDRDSLFRAHWLHGQTEHALMAVRGKPLVTLKGQTTLLRAPVRKPLGTKPPEFYDLVESLCPAPRYADIFSRYRHSDRWDCHGDDAPPADLQQAAPDDGGIPAFLRRVPS